MIRRPFAIHRRGLTLVELLLSMVGVGLVAMTVASITFAVAKGADTGKDLRDMVVRQKSLTSRLNAALRSCRLVLDHDDDYLVLWMYDSTGDGQPSLSELRLIERDADTGDLWSYKAPANLASDITYTLGDNFKTILDAIKGGGTFPGERWATGVTGWAITLDDADPQFASLVSYRITLNRGTLSEEMVGAAALRNR